MPRLNWKKGLKLLGIDKIESMNPPPSMTLFMPDYRSGLEIDQKVFLIMKDLQHLQIMYIGLRQ